MSNPDVRVKLAPEGIREVIQALRLVQRESKEANQRSAQTLSIVQRGAQRLRGLLPRVGFAAVAAGAAALARNAAAAAEFMGELAQVTGTSAENLSVFRLQAELNGAALEEQRVGLVTLASNIQRLREGAPASARAFAQLNLAAEDFIGLDTVEAAFRVAEAVASIEDPARKTAAAKALLGEAGARLIPTLEALAEKGFAGARAEAEALGIVITDDLAASAGAANDAMENIQRRVQGLALTFVSELAPFVTEAMTSVEEDTRGKGLESIRVFARGVGTAINILRLLANAAATVFQVVGNHIAGGLAVANQLVRLNFREAGVIIREEIATQRRLITEGYEQLQRDLDRLIGDLNEEPEPPKPREVGGGGGGVPATFDAQTHRARLAAQKAALDDEVALQQAALEQLNDANENAFKRGQVGLAQYFAQRRAIIERQAQLEIDAMRLQRQALAESIDLDPAQTEAERLKLLQQIGQLDTQIKTRQLQLARELAETDADRVDQAREILDAQREAANELDELEGRRHAAFERNLTEEIRQLRLLGQRAGQTAAEIEAQVERLTSARRAQFRFDEITRQGAAALDAFSRDADRIRKDAEAGVISELEGERRLIEIQRERLGILQRMAEATQAAAAATGDPEAIARAQQFADSVDQIALSFEAAVNPAQSLKSAAVDAFESGFASLLQNLDQIESVEDAFRSLARTVAQTMAQIASEILARQAVLALLRAFGGGGAGGAAAAAVAQHGGYVRGYAGGGDIAGPAVRGLPGPDNVPILAQKGEFMMRRARVMEPGALDFLRHWNAGAFTLRDVLSRPRFAAGGLIGGSAAPIGETARGERAGRLRIVNVLDPQLAVDAMNTASGEEVILNTIERNGEKIRRLVGG